MRNAPGFFAFGAFDFIEFFLQNNMFFCVDIILFFDVV